MSQEMEKKHVDDHFWRKSLLGKLVMYLLLAGALNWLAIGALHKNLVEDLVGKSYADFVYIAVGLSAIIVIVHKLMVMSHHRGSKKTDDENKKQV